MIDTRVVRRAEGRTELSACRRLYKAAGRIPADQAVVELGSYTGRTTGWLAAGAERGLGARVFAVDAWDLRSAEDIPDQPVTIERGYTNGAYRAAFPDFIEHLHAARIENVTSIRGFAAQVGLSWQGPPVGLLFHDARHTPEAVDEDLRSWLPNMGAGSLIVLHDACNPQLGVLEGARRALEAHPEWNWEGRKVYRWAKRPERRGLLVVKHA